MSTASQAAQRAAAERARRAALAASKRALAKVQGPGRTVAVSGDGLPQPGSRQGVPAGGIILQAAKPMLVVVALVTGPPRRTGGAGGVVTRGRDRRLGYDTYERTDLASWELDVILDGGLYQRSVEREARDLLTLCSPAAPDSVAGPPVLAVHGPAPLPSGLYRCGALQDGDCEYTPDGLSRTVYEGTLTLVPYQRSSGDGDGGPLSATAAAARLQAQQQRTAATASSAAALKAARNKLPGKRR